MSGKAARILPETIEAPGKGWLLPSLVGIVLLIVVVIMWWVLNDQARLALEQKMDSEASSLISYIDKDIQSRIPALRRIVRRWESSGTTKKQFIDDTAAYVTDIPGFRAIAWVDQAQHVRWIVPQINNEKFRDFNLTTEKEIAIALEIAKAKRGPVMTDPINLMNEGTGFHIYFPIFAKGEFGGFILAVFQVQHWLDHVFSVLETEGEQQEFQAAVSIDNEIVYKQSLWETYVGSPLSSKKSIESLGHMFTVYVVPTQQFFKQNFTFLPTVIAVGGFVLAMLVTFLTYLYQRASLAIWRSDLVKVALEAEINDRIRTEEELQGTSSRLSLATKAGGIGVWNWNAATSNLLWDKRMFELYDIPPDVMPTYDTWRNAIHPDDIEQVESLFTRAVEGKATFDTEFRVIHSTGEVRHMKAAARVERDEAGIVRCMTGVNWDVTEQKHAEEQILHLANHDALTGLPSLRLAKDRISLALKRAHRNKTKTAIMFIDLDGFKAVNDNHGHDAGDALLQDVATRFKSCVREEDTVARIGGDEFIIVLNGLSKRKEAETVANKLVQSASEPFFWKGNLLSVGASVGVSFYPDDGNNAESLIKSADTAMYAVKSKGKNGVAFAEKETK